MINNIQPPCQKIPLQECWKRACLHEKIGTCLVKNLPPPLAQWPTTFRLDRALLPVPYCNTMCSRLKGWNIYRHVMSFSPTEAWVVFCMHVAIVEQFNPVVHPYYLLWYKKSKNNAMPTRYRRKQAPHILSGTTTSCFDGAGIPHAEDEPPLCRCVGN